MKAIQYIRLIGKEFISLTDAELHLWVEMVRPMVSRKQFGKLYEQAIAYLVCHKLKMAGYGENPLGDMGAIGIGFAVGSVSEGGSSISFGANQSSNLATDAELGLTAYGVQFLQLRRMVIVPIHCSGELDSSGGKGKNNPCIVPVASDAVLGGIKVRPGSGLRVEGISSNCRSSPGLKCRSGSKRARPTRTAHPLRTWPRTTNSAPLTAQPDRSCDRASRTTSPN